MTSGFWLRPLRLLGHLSAKKVLSSRSSDPDVRRECCRIVQADLNYPILITRSNKTGEYVVIDGMHRLAKAYEHNMDCIDSKIVTGAMLKEGIFKR